MTRTLASATRSATAPCEATHEQIRDRVTQLRLPCIPTWSPTVERQRTQRATRATHIPREPLTCPPVTLLRLLGGGIVEPHQQPRARKPTAPAPTTQSPAQPAANFLPLRVNTLWLIRLPPFVGRTVAGRDTKVTTRTQVPLKPGSNQMYETRSTMAEARLEPALAVPLLVLVRSLRLVPRLLQGLPHHLS